jgi:pimeloyl-ACP methyl ester carboxylesterase
MPSILLDDVTLHYTEHGQGLPLLLLHAGWGLAINGFAYQEKALADMFHMILPDRRGYGRSTHVEKLDADFHWQAAQDMFGLLDALQVNETLVWGHSDGAVIGAVMAITQPTRVRSLIFEGGHLYSRKPLSRPLFEQVYHDPTLLPVPAQNRLAAYHGQEHWQQMIRNWAGAWLELWQREGDLYRGRLGEIVCSTLIMHGSQDEHTPVSEMEELARHIPNARLSIYPEAGHCVHDDHLTRETCTQEARKFFLKADPILTE